MSRTPGMQRAGAAKTVDPRAGRTPISGKRPAKPTTAEKPKKATPAAAAAAAGPAPAAAVATTSGRPTGTIRVVGDVSGPTAERFKRRVKANRWTNNIGVEAALTLLEELSDEEYNALLQRVSQTS